ncbi:hypothetical protein HETIRDRAFT_308454, partial [Heterobasidion irregulare TC 32-1]
DLLAETLVSTVTRSHLLLSDGSSYPVAVKSATVLRKFTKEPHDIKKELRLLSMLSHHAIINILGHVIDESTHTQSFWMPYIPISLRDLLSSPRFCPASYIPPHSAPVEHPANSSFIIVAKSLMYQITCGIAFLHGEPRGVAHRDIKPGNILLTQDGLVKLVDFGVSFREREAAAETQDDIWSEGAQNMYFEVGTGPYRAPELLFGTRSYDPRASDLWSLGATFAEFFTTLRLLDTSDSDFDLDGADADAEYDPTQPFAIAESRLDWARMEWERCALFDASRGDIGLAWSIFKTRGSPSAYSWPTFLDLPDAPKVTFRDAPGVVLATLLPHLPSHDRERKEGSGDRDPLHFPPQEMSPTPLDLIHRLVVYPPSSRLAAVDALRHPWFTEDAPLLLPESGMDLPPHAQTTWQDKPLACWLGALLPVAEERLGVDADSEEDDETNPIV